MSNVRSHLKKCVALLFCAVTLGAVRNMFPGGIGWKHDQADQMRRRASEWNIQIRTLTEIERQLLEKHLICFDARKPEKYRAGHIPGAISIPLGDLDAMARWTNTIEKSEPFLVYCENVYCDDGLLLCKTFRENGFTGVQLLIDGYEGWKRASRPIETSADN